MIYKLRSDRARYLNFYIEPYDIELILGDYFLLDEPEWASFWKPLNGGFSDDSDNQNLIKIPDVTVWGNHNCLLLNQIAYECLQSHLLKAGELLPISSEGIPYWLFHSTKKTNMDYVDKTKSSRAIDEVGFVDMKSLVFIEQLLTQEIIFQTEFSNYLNMYCTESFKSLVEKNGLQGLYFSTDLASINEP